MKDCISGLEHDPAALLYCTNHENLSSSCCSIIHFLCDHSYFHSSLCFHPVLCSLFFLLLCSPAWSKSFKWGVTIKGQRNECLRSPVNNHPKYERLMSIFAKTQGRGTLGHWLYYFLCVSVSVCVYVSVLWDYDQNLKLSVLFVACGRLAALWGDVSVESVESVENKNLWRDSTHGLAAETKTRTEEEEGRRRERERERELQKNRRTDRTREREGETGASVLFLLILIKAGCLSDFQQCLCWQISTSSEGLSGALLSTRPFCTFTPVITHWFLMIF